MQTARVGKLNLVNAEARERRESTYKTTHDSVAKLSAKVEKDHSTVKKPIDPAPRLFSASRKTSVRHGVIREKAS
jgi:hypothetical protein